MSDVLIRWVAGIVISALAFLLKLHFGQGKEINKNTNDITELKTSNKYIIKTMDSITETIKDQHEQDRLLMSELIKKIK